METRKIRIFKCYQDVLDKILWFPGQQTMKNYYDSLPNYKNFDGNYNLLLTNTEVRLKVNYNDILEFNAGYVIDKNGKLIFFRITDKLQSPNPQVTIISIVFDYLQSYNYANNMRNITPQGRLIRKQLKDSELVKVEVAENIRTKLDFVHTRATKVVAQKGVLFDTYFNLIYSSVNLHDSDTFGTDESPTLESSVGGTYDKISSPVNLYLIKTPTEFKNFNDYLKKFPWISQNIIKVIPIPTLFFDEINWESVLSQMGFSLYMYKNNTGNSNKNLLTIPLNDIYNIFNLKPHLLGQDNASIFITNYQGQQLELELNKINIKTTEDLTLRGDITIGYYNECAIYPVLYNSDGDEAVDGFDRGDFLNNALIINTFDTTPLQINQAEANYVKGAYNRRNERVGTLDGAYNSLMDLSQSPQEIGFNVLSTVANIGLSGSNLLKAGLNTLTYKYKQINEQRTRDLEPQSISEQSFNNSSAIANDRYGFVVKFMGYKNDDDKEMRIYYNKFGYLFGTTSGYPVENQRQVDYIQFETDFHIAEVPNTHQALVKQQLSNGILIANYPFGQLDPFNINYEVNTSR